MTGHEYIEKCLNDGLKDGPCDCGKMAESDVSYVGKPVIRCTTIDTSLKDGEAVWQAICKMKCNVCGHVAKKVARMVTTTELAELP